MSDIKLFQIQSGGATELQGDASDLEKPLQTLIESNLETLLGIRFLATEYSTGKKHGGRIDSLGLDENYCPVILEYKRSAGENVINQGLFYLDWLMDHQAEFKLLVMEKLGKESAGNIDWSAPRLVCIAADFTKYDGHAVQQINRNIELIRYRRFGDQLLLLELANATSASESNSAKSRRSTRAIGKGAAQNRSGPDKSVADHLAAMSEPMSELLASIEDYVVSLGDDIQRKELRLYIAFKRIKNFATIVIQQSKFLLYLHLDVEKISVPDDIGRDVRSIGHWGTGDLELSIGSIEDLEKAKPLIRAAYDGRAA